MSAKEVKQVSEDKQRLTEHFIVALPQLLLKVGHHGEKFKYRTSIEFSTTLYFTLSP